MKKLFLSALLILGLALPCWANSTLVFMWDANTEQDLAGYRLYQTSVQGVYDFSKENMLAEIPVGTETVTINNIEDGDKWWVLKAFDTKDNESGQSNEVHELLDTISPDVPVTLKITLIIKVE